MSKEKATPIRPRITPRIVWELPILDILAVILAFVSLVVSVMLSHRVHRHIESHAAGRVGPQGNTEKDVFVCNNCTLYVHPVE
jgi:hypothetical protein